MPNPRYQRQLTKIASQIQHSLNQQYKELRIIDEEIQQTKEARKRHNSKNPGWEKLLDRLHAMKKEELHHIKLRQSFLKETTTFIYTP